MVPAAGQGIVGITVRPDDTELRELLAGIEDPEAKAGRHRRARDAGCGSMAPAARPSAAMPACCRMARCA